MEDYNQNPYGDYPGDDLPERPVKPKKKMTLKRRIRRLRKKLSRMSSGSLLILGGSVLLFILIVVVLLIVLLPKKDKQTPTDQLSISDAATMTPTLQPIATPTFSPVPTPEPIATLETPLDLNMTSDLVPDIQEKLIELGYMEMPSGGVTDKYGPATKIAMRIFQYKNDLERDGICGQITYSLLMSDALPADGGPKPFFLSRNDNDKDNLYEQGHVARLQQRLIQLGYFKETASGHFGASTVTAVQKFQQDNNLEADGKAGQQTLTLLYSDTVVDALTAQLNKQSATTAPGASTSPAAGTGTADPAATPATGTTAP